MTEKRDVFWDGLAAGTNLNAAKSNPYTPGTRLHERWHEGWQNGIAPDHDDKD